MKANERQRRIIRMTYTYPVRIRTTWETVVTVEFKDRKDSIDFANGFNRQTRNRRYDEGHHVDDQPAFPESEHSHRGALFEQRVNHYCVLWGIETKGITADVGRDVSFEDVAAG